jgi:tetraacyldisaccharide 4'-kinase
VVVVGNISVGGTGKSPLVIWLVNRFREQGYNPGVISRGYGGQAPHYPFSVTETSLSQESGDEPLMIANRCGCPVVVDADRVRAASYLLDTYDCDLIISDDGLQHYALGRDIEIVVIDGVRGLGNRHCLPVGPLREPETRLDEVDLIVVNGDDQCSMVKRGGHSMHLEPGPVHALNGKPVTLNRGRVNAVAGIGNPERFFRTLEQLGFEVLRHPFADHHRFKAGDFAFDNGYPVIMTEKDAVKCQGLVADRLHYLPVSACLGNEFVEQLSAKLAAIERFKQVDPESK